MTARDLMRPLPATRVLPRVTPREPSIPAGWSCEPPAEGYDRTHWTYASADGLVTARLCVACTGEVSPVTVQGGRYWTSTALARLGTAAVSALLVYLDDLDHWRRAR